MHPSSPPARPSKVQFQNDLVEDTTQQAANDTNESTGQEKGGRGMGAAGANEYLK